MINIFRFNIPNHKCRKKIVPTKKILVSEDSIRFDTIRIKPLIQGSDITIKWKLISTDFKSDGVLKLSVKTTVKTEDQIFWVDSKEEEKTEIGEIEDYIGDIKDFPDN